MYLVPAWYLPVPSGAINLGFFAVTTGYRTISDTMSEITKPISIALVISGLGPGGAERVATILANHWVGLGWRVTVLAMDRDDTLPYFALKPGSTVRRMGLLADSPNPPAALSNTIRRVRTLRAELRRAAPDIVLSLGARTNVLCLLAVAGLHVPVVAAERSDPGQHQIGDAWSWLRRRLYPRAAAIVAQSKSALAFFQDMPLKRRVVIGNPICAPETASDAQASKIVGVGRLTREKGFDLLIDAFARIAEEHPHWSLVIYGEGPERSDLVRRIIDRGLEKRVSLPGRTAQPGQWIDGAAIFVLPSRYEGFPNALGEALAAGLPTIAFDCRSGPSEMIDNGKDGMLLAPEDTAALATALGCLIREPQTRVRLGTAARQSMRRFAPDVILPRWTDLIVSLIENKS